ncbi:MAG: hypothetical protein H7332_11775 [Bdellovibrionales bacterium]|nr:hypothetical protein [Ramlibacter sp.]
MDHLFRRQSGIYFCRLVVPARHRAIVGRIELLSSTGVRDLAIAKIVGAELVAQWRRHFLDIESLTNPMNVIQLKIGSPTLLGAGYLPLQQASEASGLDPDELLRHATQNRIRIYIQPGQTEGFMVPYADLDFDDLANHAGLVVPSPGTMPRSAVAIDQPRLLTFHPADVNAHCLQLLEVSETEVILFSMVGKPYLGFAPKEGLNNSKMLAGCAHLHFESRLNS